MPNPLTENIIGSGFDSIAAQRQQWAGYNNGVDRANLEAQARAQDARNDYLFRAAQLARQDQGRQDALQSSADNDARHQYEFGQTMDFQNKELAARQQAEKDANAATSAKKGAQLDTDKTNLRIQQAQGEIQARTFDPVNYADLPKDTLAFLNRIDSTQRAQEQKSYFDSVALARDLNQKNVLAKQVSLGPPKIGPESSIFTGQLTAGEGPALNPDASWFSDYQKRFNDLSTKLAPYQIDKVGAAQYGLTLNPTTGRYEPVSQPAWMASTGGQTPPAPATVSMPATAPVSAPKVLDVVTARQFLDQAGGDKNLARQLAIKAGYTIQPLQ